MHAASRHGTPSLTSLPKDGEVSCEVRPQWSPIRILTSLYCGGLQNVKFKGNDKESFLPQIRHMDSKVHPIPYGLFLPFFLLLPDQKGLLTDNDFPFMFRNQQSAKVYLIFLFPTCRETKQTAAKVQLRQESGQFFNKLLLQNHAWSCCREF